MAVHPQEAGLPAERVHEESGPARHGVQLSTFLPNIDEREPQDAPEHQLYTESSRCAGEAVLWQEKVEFLYAEIFCASSWSNKPTFTSKPSTPIEETCET